MQERVSSPTQYFTGLFRYGERLYGKVFDSYLQRFYFAKLPNNTQFGPDKKSFFVEGVGRFQYNEEEKYFAHVAGDEEQSLSTSRS